MRFLYFLFPFLAFQDCKTPSAGSMAESKNDNTLLWEISGNGLSRPSYLFGTFHIMCKEDIHISNNLKEAVKASDEVYFEMDMDDMSNMIGALKFMKMKNDTTLKDLYSKAEYEKLEAYFRDSLNTPLLMIQNMKPLFLQALFYPKMMECKTLSGMEDRLVNLAQENKKDIKGFETIEFQASVFDSIPYKLQAKELLKSLDSMAGYKDDFEKMMQTYKKQNLSEIESLFDKEEFGIGENREILLDNRNRNWVAQLKNLLPAKSVFIAVGAGHLVGTNGLISLLRKEGYTVKGIEN